MTYSFQSKNLQNIDFGHVSLYYYKDKTIIVISHRKENIDLYDRMIKFSNGKVINLERRRCDE